MDSTQFDALAARLAARLNRRGGLSLLAGASLPLVGLAGLTEAGKKKKKVTLCVNGQTVKKPRKKARKLRRQGATSGPCPVTTAPPRCGAGGPCFVFVSSGAVTGGAFGSLTSADATCQEFARSAGLPGTYRAWLSAGGESPSNRFSNRGSAGPYVLPAPPQNGGAPGRGTTVANSFAELIACPGDQCLLAPIDRDERGSAVTSSSEVWTGTRNDGTASDSTCNDWTSDAESDFGQIGSSDNVDPDWTESLGAQCDGARSVYCFQQAT
ncbi:MAG: hypothetical protein R2853_11850 [Thermomicrobiales bacterium]